MLSPFGYVALNLHNKHGLEKFTSLTSSLIQTIDTINRHRGENTLHPNREEKDELILVPFK
jgi:hypothetical protein